MKRFIGTWMVLVAVCVTTSVASADHSRHQGGHYAPAHRPTPNYSYRHGGAHFDHGHGHPQPYHHQRPPVVTGYRGNYHRPLPPPAYCPPDRSNGGFNYYGRNFGFSFGY